MRLGRTAGGKPAAPRRGEDDRPRLLADEGEPFLGVQVAGPLLQAELAQSRGEPAPVPDQAELRDTDERGWSKGAFASGFFDATMGDELDDVAGGVVEVARQRIPVVEVEDHLAGLAAWQELDPVADPVESAFETVARYEEREVVEGLAGACDEGQLGLAEPDPAFVEPLQAKPVCVELVELPQQIRRSMQKNPVEPHRGIFNRPGSPCLKNGKTVGTIVAVGWVWILLLACAVAVLVAAEWPRLQARAGLQERRKRWRRRRQPELRVIRGDDDDSEEFAASVERDLAQLPSTNDRDRS